jgi:beta-lactam-binding protein with PASTA domain
MTSPAVPILNFGGSGGRKIAVPNLEGKTLAEAEQELEAAGLRCRSQEVEASGPIGKVVSQEPAKGRAVAPKTQVLVNVAIAPPGPPPDFDKLLKDLTTAVAAATAELSQLRADVTQVNAQVATVSTEVTQVKVDVAAVGAAVKDVEQEGAAKGRHEEVINKLEDISKRLPGSSGPVTGKKP